MSFACVSIFKKKKKKKTKKFKKKNFNFLKISKSFPKKREKFSNEKSHWTRGIEPLSH